MNKWESGWFWGWVTCSLFLSIIYLLAHGVPF